MAEDITALFNQFAGKEVPMVEREITQTFLGKTFTEKVLVLADQNDQTIKAIEKTAEDNKLSLLILWQGGCIGVPTRDINKNRVNIDIEKSADGKYRISKKFKVG